MRGIAPLLPFFFLMLVAAIPLFAIRATSLPGKAIRLLSSFIALAGLAALARAAEGDAKTPSAIGLAIAIPYFFCWIGQVFARRGWPLLEAILSLVAFRVVYASTGDVMAAAVAALAATLLAAGYTTRKAPVKAFIDD